MSDTGRDALFIITTGKEDGGRKATIALAMAVSSLGMGVKTSIFLTGSGSVWADVKQSVSVQIDGFENLSTYFIQFAELGGKLLICTPCLKFFCGLDDISDLEKEKEKLYANSEFVGFATIADMIPFHSVINF